MKAVIGILLMLTATTAFAQNNLSVTAPAQIQPVHLIKTPITYGCRETSTVYVIDGIVPLKPVPAWHMNSQSDYVLTREDIEHMPYTNINDMISLFPGVYQNRRGSDVSIFGSRLR